MKKWLYAAAAVLIAIGFGILTRDGRKAKTLAASRDELLLDGSRRSRDKAMQAGRRADVLQADAEKAAKVGQAAIDKVGSKDETMAQLLDSWRSERVL